MCDFAAEVWPLACYEKYAGHEWHGLKLNLNWRCADNQGVARRRRRGITLNSVAFMPGMVERGRPPRFVSTGVSRPQ